MKASMNRGIFLRCHISTGKTKPASKNETRVSLWPEYVLVFDTETTTDTRQALNFGAYRFCRADANAKYICLEEGLFHTDNICTKELSILQRYCKKEMAETLSGYPGTVKLYSRYEFVEQVFYRSVQSDAAIVGFNLPFDISRLAVEYRSSRFAGGRAWSLILFQYYDRQKRRLRPNTYRPRLQVIPKDSKTAFFRLVGGDTKQPYKRGRFLDLKTLTWALRNKNLSLNSACDEFGVPGKIDHKPTGQITKGEIDYCRGDVRCSVGLLNALRIEYAKYPVDLAPEKAFSAASIAKAFLHTMRLIPPKERFHLDDDEQGICMQTYYGGRSEIRIRHTSVPVVYTDFLSQYPTVNILLGMWDLLIADKLETADVTNAVRTLLGSLKLEDLFSSETWPKLAFFALVEPNEDIFPVRTVYGDAHIASDTNIGLNYLTSKKPIWFAGPDVVASLLLGDKVPKILRAIKFIPVGVQKGLKAVALGANSIDPRRDNFFRKIIEERKRSGTPETLQYFLKILANAGCYGIYGEVNRIQTGKNQAKELALFSGEHHSNERTCVVEQPGPWYFPPMAALTTSGGRLLLAMLERAVINLRGQYLMCDTDSMAIVANKHSGDVPCDGGSHQLADGTRAVRALSWREVDSIKDRFATLNPYDQSVIPGSILKIEDINRDSKGQRRQLHGYGISAKRYTLFTLNKNKIHLVKVSEHGLGLYYRPKEGRDSECNVSLWIKEGWEFLLSRALGRKAREPRWFRLPAMRRIAISTPHVMSALRRLDREKARPYNFALSPVLLNLTNSPYTLLAPFEKNPARWLKMPYINIHDGTICSLVPPTQPILAQTFAMIFADYARHSEPKSLGPDGNTCTAHTRGLLKRHWIVATGFHVIGKETERAWEDAEDVSTLLPSLVRYAQQTNSSSEQLRERLRQIPLNTLQHETGLSRHSIIRVRSGKRVHARTIKRLYNVLVLV